MDSGEKADNFFVAHMSPCLCLALTLILGILFSYGVIFYGVSAWWGAFGIVLPLLVFSFGKNKKKGLTFSLILLAVFAVGAGNFSVRIQAYLHQPLDGEYTVYGTVEEIFDGEDPLLLLSDVHVDGQKDTFSVRIYGSADGLSVGQTVKVRARLTPTKGNKKRFFTYEWVNKNIKYTAVAQESYTVTGYRFSLFRESSKYLSSLLKESMGKEESAVYYALVTGNTGGVDEGLLTSVRYGGVGHLFAVSGLHVGIVFAVVSALFSRVKKKEIKLLFPLLFTFLFCAFCNFTPSSVRAFILVAVLSLSRALFFKSDRLESLSLAAFILCLIQPATLFSTGFLLSFSACFGGMVLSPALSSEVVRKIKQGQGGYILKIAQFLLFTASIQLCILPVQLACFGYASILGIGLNIIVIPLFSLCFPVFLGLLLLACSLPFGAGVILFLPAFILKLVCIGFSRIDFSPYLLRGVAFSSIALICYFLLLFLVVKRPKRGSSLTLLFVAIVLVDCILNTFPQADLTARQLSARKDGLATIINAQGQNVLLVKGRQNQAELQTFVFRYTQKIDALILSEEDPLSALSSLLFLNVEKIYVRQGVETGLQTVKVEGVEETTIGGVTYAFTLNGGIKLTGYGLTGSFGDETIFADYTFLSESGRDQTVFSIDDGKVKTKRE